MEVSEDLELSFHPILADDLGEKASTPDGTTRAAPHQA
jgi:hypothetical protein